PIAVGSGEPAAIIRLADQIMALTREGSVHVIRAAQVGEVAANDRVLDLGRPTRQIDSPGDCLSGGILTGNTSTILAVGSLTKLAKSTATAEVPNSVDPRIVLRLIANEGTA